MVFQISFCPACQHQQAPERVPLPARPGQVRSVDPIRDVLVDQVSDPGAAIEDRRFEHRPQRAAEPVVDGDLEALFSPLEDRIRQ